MRQGSDSNLTSEEEYRNIFNAASDGLVIYDIGLDAVVEANPAACEIHGYTRQEFIGLNPEVFMPPESLALFKEDVRMAEPGRVFESLIIHKRRDGTTVYTEVRRSAIKYRGRPCLLSVIRDVSKRIQTEKILGRQIEVQMHEQATLLAISHTLASTIEFQPGLILEQLHEIIEYSHGALFALEDSALVTMATRGTPQLEDSSPFRIRLEGPKTLAALFNGHGPIRIPDIRSDHPQAQFLRTFLEEEASALLKGMQSWMWVPLAVKNRVIGCLGVAHEKRNHFTSHHADLALSVANQAAITMVNAELYKDAQKLGVLEERQNLARNLHDAVNQSLFSAGLIADVLPRLWDRDQPEARRSLEDLRRLTRAAQAEMRALLAELRPSALTDTDLGELFRLLGNALSGRINVLVTVTVKHEVILPAEVQVAFYRVCQEALNNIARHANASHVDIDLKDEGTFIELRVHDNGKGFDPGQILSGHYGLTMMRERADAVGSSLTVTSEPGLGTELIMRWIKHPKKESK
jgi:PAS domain S-box-containing protein